MSERYKSWPSSWLRIYLEATDNFFGHRVARSQRLDVASELTRRVIEEEAEATDSWPALPIKDEQ